MNLRGRIVMVLDLRRCLGVPERPDAERPVNLVLRTADNSFGLLADAIGEVLEVDERTLARRPDHARGPGHELIAGVIRLDAELLRVLDVDRVRARATSWRGSQEGANA
jgi:purine-binding chemotaxis protein CheW